MNYMTSLIAVGALALSAGVASAATITLAGSVLNTDQCSLANFTTSLACDGNFTVAGQGEGGNVAASDLNGLFAADGITLSNWQQIDRIGSVAANTTQLR